MRIFTFLSKRVICILAFSLLSLDLFSQVSVTATAGTVSASYTTVNAAFTAINAGTHQGDIIITVTANTTEPATPIPLLKSASPSSYTSIKLAPSGNVTINSAAAAVTNRGIIELAGADNVTIDGDDPLTAGTSNLTILAATSTTAGIACIRLSSNSTTGTDGADNNKVRNCTIVGSRAAANSTVVNYGIQFSNGVAASAAATGAYSSINTIIENNIITRCLYGIWANGTSATYLNTGTIIRKNILGSATVADNIGARGIYLQYSGTSVGSGNAIVEENDIRIGEVSASATGYALNIYGVMLEAANTGCIVRKNNIHDVMQPSTSGYLSAGVAIVSATSNASIEIYNNFIRDIVASKYSALLPSSFVNYGIYINAAATDVKINHNTIAMLVPNATGTVVNGTSACILITSTATAAEIRNNILINNNVSTQAFGIFTAATTNISGAVMNNNCYSTGSMGYYNATNQATLATWQTATNKDANSFVNIPSFISATNLHLTAGTVSRLESGGLSTSITTDIDGDTRPGPVGSVNGGGAASDIGADEFDGIPLPANNISATAFVNPVNAGTVPTGISFTPQATFTNNGLSAQVGVTVRFKILNSGNTVIYNQTATTGSLNSGAGETVSFPSTTITTAGTYTIQAIAELVGDAIASDNQINGTITAVAPLCGNYHIGSAQPAPFNTLTSAVNAIKLAGMSCAVTFLLDDATYSTAETFPITITEIPGASANNTLTIKPNTGNTVAISGNIDNALIKLNGADYVTINGSNSNGSDRSLSLINLTTGTTSSSIIWIGSASANDGANYNTIKNCKIIGGGTTVAGIITGSGVTYGSAAAISNSNNTVQNNFFASTQNAIYSSGYATSPFDENWTVDGNTLGSTSPTDKFSYRGLFFANAGNLTISNNRIYGVTSTAASTAAMSGIQLGSNISGSVFNNKIDSIRQINTTAYGAYGMQLGVTSTSAINIYNNFISNVTAYGSATIASSAHGIYIASGAGYNIHFNTVSLAANSTLATGIYAPLTISSGVSTTAGLNIQNNIFSNTQTTGVRYAIYSAVTAANNAAVYAVLDYNNYWSAGTNLAYFTAANQANLAALQGAFGNGGSHQIQPVFVSASDLHLSNDAANLSLDNLGISVPTITTDIDAQTRNASTPDLGADEFVITACTGANGGTITSANASALCVSGATTLSATAYSTGLNSNYQWQYSSDNFVADIHDLANEINPLSAATGTITATTYYRLKVTCTSASATGYSNTVTVTVNNPQVLTAVPATRCGTGTVTLTGTGSAGTTLNWYANSTGGTPLGSGNSFVTPTVNTTTTFYVAASSGGSTVNIGKLNTAAADGNYNGTATGLVFNALTDLTINSVKVYPIGSGAGSIEVVLRNSAGTIISTATVPVTGTASPGVLTTIPLSFAVPVGTAYRLELNAITGLTGLNRDYTAGVSFPYTAAGIASITGGWLAASSTTYYYFYDWSISTGCESGRTSVDAIVNAAPSLTVSADKTICNNTVDSVRVTSNLANFNTYTWSPVTNLFTDAACTIAYTAGTNANKLYVKGTTVGKTPYKVTANNTTTFCANEAVDTIYIMPAPSLTITPAALCMSGTATLTLNPATGYGNGFFQWQESANGTSYADISGANGTSYTTPTISSTTYYKMLLRNSLNENCSSPATATVTVNNPQVLTTVPGTRCGTGAVSLSATGSAGTTLSWYANPTGGASLGTGNSFLTPSINTTTPYYVSAGNGASSSFMGQPSYVATVPEYTNLSPYGFQFTLTQAITLNSVRVFSSGGSAITISLYNSGGTTQLQTTGSVSVTAGTTTTPSPNDVTLGWALTPGTYRLVVATMTGNFVREFNNYGGYPKTYTVGTIDGYVTSLTGTVNTSGAAYYYLYNWSVSTVCESARTAVTATVDNSPGCVPTPITLLSFTGERKNSINTLNWATANELNNAGFELQRSADGINFSKLATISSKAVNGNSTATLQYSFADAKSLTTTSYYRLKQIDKDGKSSFSNIVMLKGDKATQLVMANIYPNPAKEKLNITLASPKADRITLIVTDVTGKQVMIKSIDITSGDNNLQLNVQHLTQGSYLVKAICADGCQTAVKLFVKD